MASCPRVLSKKKDSTEVCKNNPWHFVSNGILGGFPTEKGNGLVLNAGGPRVLQKLQRQTQLWFEQCLRNSLLLSQALCCDVR